METNLSTFDHNVLHGLAGVADTVEALEAGEVAYLRGVDRDRLAAERAAVEAVIVTQRTDPMLAAAVRGHGLTEDPGVLPFIQERVFRRHFPGN